MVVNKGEGGRGDRREREGEEDHAAIMSTLFSIKPSCIYCKLAIFDDAGTSWTGN